jgi:beta-N-acetylhexosaminidase
MLDVAGLVLSEAEQERIANPLVGGVILFARNYDNPLQLTELTSAIRQIRPQSPPLIAVDHEGGRVQRFRSGFSVLPPMRRLGEVFDHNPEQGLALAQAIGTIIGHELSSHGVDLSFTPVLDLDYGVSRVIGDRAFHSDPESVAVLAGALIDGLASQGLAAVGKHFPGHGFVAADSHLEIPVDWRSFDDLWNRDLRPFIDLKHCLAGVMPAHVSFPAVDRQPAGFSSDWIQKILREKIGFAGAVFSDDLSMEGATVAGDIVARANAAYQAGCDMVLVCNAPDKAVELLQNWSVSVDSERSTRIHSLRAKTEKKQENHAYLMACSALADFWSLQKETA